MVAECEGTESHNLQVSFKKGFIKKLLEVFKVHRKTSLSESLFNEIASVNTVFIKHLHAVATKATYHKLNSFMIEIPIIQKPGTSIMK